MIQRRFDNFSFVLCWTTLPLFDLLLFSLVFDSIEETGAIGAFYLIPIAGLTVLFLWGMNIAGGVVYIDLKNKRIGRRGWLWGYRSEIGFEDIKQVLIVSFGRGGFRIVLVDSVNKYCSPGRKYSYISLSYTQKDIDFIRRAWGGPIIDERGKPIMHG